MSVGSRTLDVQLDSLLVALHTQVGWWRVCEQAGARRCAPAMGVPAEGPREQDSGAGIQPGGPLRASRVIWVQPVGVH